MAWLTRGRLIALGVVAIYIAMIVTASTMGMFGTMFEGFFGPVG
jgi:hypothetical protein